jgi:ribosome biogenesis GTPase
MGRNLVEGLVVRVTGGEVRVDVDGQTIPCILRGRFRKQGKGFQLVAGDRVEVSLPESEGAPGAIEGLIPRRSWLSRYATGRGAGERVIVANIDVLILVASVREPQLHFGFIDRVLVSAERGHTPVCICLNKIDLMEDESEIAPFLKIYPPLGYSVIRTSAETGDGLDGVKRLLEKGIYAFVGQSGVGKSSLLNSIDESLKLKVRDVANKTGRGRHTTAYSELFTTEGGYIADTPGMQTFGFPGTEAEELPACFPEFRPLEPYCRFQPCTHSHEPGCAVKEALERDLIVASRYRSYEQMLEEVAERKTRR